MSVDLRQDPRPSVRVAGELDVASAGLLTAMLEHARRTSRPSAPGAVPALDDVVVDVDLADVTFVDSRGLAPVLDSPTRIVRASTVVRRLLVVLRAG